MNEEIRATHDEHGSRGIRRRTPYEVVVVHLEESPGVPSEIRDTILVALALRRRVLENDMDLGRRCLASVAGRSARVRRAERLREYEESIARVDAAAAWVRKGGA